MKHVSAAIHHLGDDQYVFMGRFKASGSNPTDAFMNMLNQHARYDGVNGRVMKVSAKKTVVKRETVTSDPHKWDRDLVLSVKASWDRLYAEDSKNRVDWTLSVESVNRQHRLVYGEHYGLLEKYFKGELNPVTKEVLTEQVMPEQDESQECSHYRIGMAIPSYHRILNLTLPVSHWVWMLVYRSFPPDKITHRDGNKLNNRIENLKVAVKKSALPHQCVVLHNGKQHHLGRYATPAEVDAARAEFLRKQVALT